MARGGQSIKETPYAELQSTKSRKARVALLMDVARYLAGGDPTELISDAAGLDNVTTSAIARQFATNVHEGPSDANHAWRVQALSFISDAGASRSVALALGIDAGKDLWRTALGHVGGTYARNRGDGRPIHAKTTYLKGRWADCSHPTARVDACGEPVRVTYGPKRQLCAQLAKEAGCSVSTAKKASGSIVAARRREDICDYCDCLRRARIRALQTAGEEIDEFAGCSVTREKFKDARSANRLTGVSAMVCTLEQHESFAADRQNAFVADWALAANGGSQTLVLRADFSGKIKVTNVMGTSDEYYNALFCSALAAVCPDDDVGATLLLDPFNHPHTAWVAAMQVAQCIKEAVARRARPCADVIVWLDTGRHFRAMEFLQTLLVGATDGNSHLWGHLGLRFRSLRCRFFAEGHGKGECDTIFGLAKRAFANHIQRQDAHHVWAAKLEAHCGGARVSFFDERVHAALAQYPREALALKDISCAYEFAVADRTGHEVLYVEGAEARLPIVGVGPAPQPHPAVRPLKRDSQIVQTARRKLLKREAKGWGKS